MTTALGNFPMTLDDGPACLVALTDENLLIHSPTWPGRTSATQHRVTLRLP